MATEQTKQSNDYKFCVVAKHKKSDGYDRDIETVLTTYDAAIKLIGEIKNNQAVSDIRLYQMKFMGKY